MPETPRPAAPPQAQAPNAAQPEGDYWRDGEFLVLRRGADFPGHGCAKCGSPASPPARRYLLAWLPVPAKAINISAMFLMLSILIVVAYFYHFIYLC